MNAHLRIDKYQFGVFGNEEVVMSYAMPHDKTMLEEHGLCPHSTADEGHELVESWKRGEISSHTLSIQLGNLGKCKACRSE